ncbi:MAG: ABC transporter permease [Kosmotoga sp.]|nr:ABC transporter permease [Kosmotoga sp.]MBO8166553.1 ABC transporter permease [Kosmotoga sp.]
MKKITTLLSNELKMIFRSRSIWIYFLLLPMAMVLFTGVFNMNNGLYALRLGVVNEDNTFLGIFFIRYATSMVKEENIYVFKTRNEAENQLKDLDGYFIIPKGFANDLLFQKPSKLIFVPNPDALQSGIAIYQVLSNVLNEFKALPVIADPNFMKNVTVDPNYKAPEIVVEGVDGDKFNFKEFLFPLILALCLLLTLGIGLSWSIHEDQRTEILDFLVLANTRALQFLFSKIVSFLVVGIFEFCFFLLFGLLFGYEGLINIVENTPLFLMLSLVFITMSVFLTSLTRTSRGSQFLVTGVSVVFILISGMLIPRSMFPEWLRKFADYFPMTALLSEIQKLSLIPTDLKTIIGLLISNTVLTTVFILLSVIMFRYSSDHLSAM